MITKFIHPTWIHPFIVSYTFFVLFTVNPQDPKLNPSKENKKDKKYKKDRKPNLEETLNEYNTTAMEHINQGL